MKEGTSRSRRIRVIAAICAMVVIAGGSAGVYALRQNTNAKAAPAETASVSTSAAADNGIINAGGTITSSQLADSFGMEGTAVRLGVEKVLAEQGETVKAGTPLYQITSDSLAKAEKTLNSELQTAKNALLEQKISYQTDKNEAYLLYQSELMLGTTAQSEYDSGIASLDSALNKAKESYQEALDTINDTPAKIEAKQAELTSKQTASDTLQAKCDSLRQEINNAEAGYKTAAESYNCTAAEYNAAAGVVRYLGNALGRDTSDIVLAQTVTAESQEQSAPSDDRSKGRGKNDNEQPTFDMTDGKSFPRTSAASIEAAPVKEINTESSDLGALYETALKEYNSYKEKLTQAEKDMETAKAEYSKLTEQLSAQSTELSSLQNTVTELDREISEMNSSLSKAKSNVTKLKSEYNSLSASYSTDQLELKNKLDTDMASYENAEYHYQITCSTIEGELEEKQTAYDKAEENLRIFTEELAEGYIYAKQDGTIYSLNCQEGRNVNINSPYVYYVDESGFSTTVELDQNDVTQVSIGDKVIIYSSESGTVNGKITAISEGTSTSLADVRFNVTATADEGAELYVGQSVNVYFNYGNMQAGSFSDFSGSKSGSDERSGSGSGMPGGFDPSNMPGSGGGMPEGFDPSNMPDFGRRKDN